MKKLLRKLTAFGFCAVFAFMISGCDLISANFTKQQYAQAIGNVANTIDILTSDSTEQSRTLSMFYDDPNGIFKATDINEVSWEVGMTKNVLKFVKGILEDPTYELSNEISAFDILADNSYLYQPANFNIKMKVSHSDNIYEFIIYTNLESGNMEQYTKVLTDYNPNNYDKVDFSILLVDSHNVDVFIFENEVFYILDDTKDLSTFEEQSRTEFDNFKLNDYVERDYNFNDLYNRIMNESYNNNT